MHSKTNCTEIHSKILKHVKVNRPQFDCTFVPAFWLLPLLFWLDKAIEQSIEGVTAGAIERSSDRLIEWASVRAIDRGAPRRRMRAES